jgi:hypothetical protein
MAQYQIKDPQGGMHIIEGPDGATPDQVMAAAQQVMAAHQAAVNQVANDPITKGAQNFAADMPMMDKFNAGVGKAVNDIGTGIGQRLGLVSRQDVKDQRQIDAPLMNTTAGKVGNIAGNVTMIAPASLVPGAQSVPAAAAIGGFVGALQPSASTTEDVANMALGAAGGAAGQAVANKAAGSVAFQQAQNATKAAQGAQKATAAKAASDAGYVIPPEDLGNSGLATKLLQAAGGKIKTAQVASQQNQPTTNSLARAALGISEDTPLTPQALAQVRNAAGDAYNVVKGTGTVTADPAYTQALDAIAQKYTTAARDFPDAVKSDVPSLMEALKQPTFSPDGAVEMTKILRGKADTAFASGDKGNGAAYKQAADALENMLGRHLEAQNLPDALSAFQNARQLIAKTYTVGKALNPTTGDVNAQVLANQLQKGKPLTGDLLTIAQAGESFPKATQMLKEAPKTWSPLDIAYAGRNVATGNLKGMAADAATLGVRPLARTVMLSGPMQRNAIANAGNPASVNLLTRILANNEAMLPTGIAAGNALAAQLSR